MHFLFCLDGLGQKEQLRLMNISANMLGLGNAATPIGLKAMEELQKLNQNREYASNAMCMLLAINTSSVELIPAAIIGYRAAAGSTDIMRFWPLMVLTTVTSTVVAVIVCKFCERLRVFKVPEPLSQTQPGGGEVQFARRRNDVIPRSEATRDRKSVV